MSTGEDNDNDVVDAYLKARPIGEKDAPSAERIGVTRPQFTKIRNLRKHGKDVSVHDSTRERIVQATNDLQALDSVARARMEGMREAIAMMRPIIEKIEQATAALDAPIPAASSGRDLHDEAADRAREFQLEQDANDRRGTSGI